MKLEVGMYVRHKPLISREYVKINKIKEIEEKENCLHIWLEDKDLITEKYILKASHNIIDLIEVGDYVNGHKVYDDFRLDTDDYGNNFIEIGAESDKFLNHYIREDEIKSIVTKEQFESIKYSLDG